MAVDPSVTFVGAPRPPSGTGAGAAGAVQIRLGGESYIDDGDTLAGADRPNARLISNVVFDQPDGSGNNIDMPDPGGISSLFWVWGQFIDHDLDQTRTSGAAGAAPSPPDDDPESLTAAQR